MPSVNFMLNEYKLTCNKLDLNRSTQFCYYVRYTLCIENYFGNGNDGMITHIMIMQLFDAQN